MGGNNSYNKSLRGVPKVDRTHNDTGQRVAGHKVLVQKNHHFKFKFR